MKLTHLKRPGAIVWNKLQRHLCIFMFKVHVVWLFLYKFGLNINGQRFIKIRDFDFHEWLRYNGMANANLCVLEHSYNFNKKLHLLYCSLKLIVFFFLDVFFLYLSSTNQKRIVEMFYFLFIMGNPTILSVFQVKTDWFEAANLDPYVYRLSK